MAKIITVILAAGLGIRLGAERPKAFVDLKGKSLLEHTVEEILSTRVINEIIVVVPDILVEESSYMYGSYIHIAMGGRNRTISVTSALKEIVNSVCDRTDLILIHDAARALAPCCLIKEIITSLINGYPAVIPGVTISDTAKFIDIDKNIISTPNRNKLKAIQTPQGFHADVIYLAYQNISTNSASDDASLVENIGIPVHFIEGNPLAFKITTLIDFLLAETIIESFKL